MVIFPDWRSNLFLAFLEKSVRWSWIHLQDVRFYLEESRQAISENDRKVKAILNSFESYVSNNIVFNGYKEYETPVI
jgi:hypothetical protein